MRNPGNDNTTVSRMEAGGDVDVPDVRSDAPKASKKAFDNGSRDGILEHAERL
jgi:hypothetical protein